MQSQSQFLWQYVWLNASIGDIAWSDKWCHVNLFVWDQIYAQISHPPNLINFFLSWLICQYTQQSLCITKKVGDNTQSTLRGTRTLLQRSNYNIICSSSYKNLAVGKKWRYFKIKFKILGGAEVFDFRRATVFLCHLYRFLWLLFPLIVFLFGTPLLKAHNLDMQKFEGGHGPTAFAYDTE